MKLSNLYYSNETLYYYILLANHSFLFRWYVKIKILKKTHPILIAFVRTNKIKNFCSHPLIMHWWLEPEFNFKLAIFYRFISFLIKIQKIFVLHCTKKLFLFYKFHVLSELYTSFDFIYLTSWSFKANNQLIFCYTRVISAFFSS